MDEDTHAPAVEAPKPKTFELSFQIPEEMLETFARIGLEVVLKQRLQEISDTVKR
jgi:hypothetical protein